MYRCTNGSEIFCWNVRVNLQYRSSHKEHLQGSIVVPGMIKDFRDFGLILFVLNI